MNFKLKKLHDANSAISEKLYVALKSRMEERRIDFIGLLQYLHNGKSSVSGIDFITVPSSIKCENSFRNEVSIEIDSQSDCSQIPLSVCGRTR